VNFKIYVRLICSLFTWSIQKWLFWSAGFYPANQSNLKSFLKALINWKKAGPPKMPLLFWSCKLANDIFENNYFCKIIKTRNCRELGAEITFPPSAGSFAPRPCSLSRPEFVHSQCCEKREKFFCCTFVKRSVIFSSLSKHTLIPWSGVQVWALTFKMVPLSMTQASHTLKQVLR